MDWGSEAYPLSNSRACSSARLQPKVHVKDSELPHSHDHTFSGSVVSPSVIPGVSFPNNNIGYLSNPIPVDVTPNRREGFDNKLESLDSMINRPVSPNSKVEVLLHKYRQLALDAVTLLKSEREDRELIKENMARAAFDAYKSFEDDLKNKALEAVKEMQVEMSKERAIYTTENEELIEKCKRMEREFNRIRNINLNECRLMKFIGENDRNNLLELAADTFDKFKNDFTQSVIKAIDTQFNTQDTQFNEDVEEFVHVAILSQATI